MHLIIPGNSQNTRDRRVEVVYPNAALDLSVENAVGSDPRESIVPTKNLAVGEYAYPAGHALRRFNLKNPKAFYHLDKPRKARWWYVL